ncbi:hypothetical protein CPB84DRAFT_1768563, partial [Gymnopilus junonius]
MKGPVDRPSDFSSLINTDITTGFIVMTSLNGLDNLLPELFPIIASHLPLYATPSTLLSLALVKRHISEIVLPILYWCLILKNEDDALGMIHRLLGLTVRQLHIMSDLSVETRDGRNPFDVVTGLKEVIKLGLLPNIHNLGLYLLSGWHYDEEYELVEGYGDLRADFWDDVREKCPRLKGIILNNIGDIEGDRWLEDCGLYDIQGITSLTLLQSFFPGSERGHAKLMEIFKALAHSLHTLSFSQLGDDWLSASSFFALDFPNLKALTLNYHVVEDALEAMAFWKRHPTIESLELKESSPTNRYFTNDLDLDFLPNLCYLKADYHDVRLLAPILHRLIGLEIDNSVNAQIPYLLRFVLPQGLPNLKSLSIGQYPSSSSKNERTEGALWFETEDGEFMEKKDWRSSTHVYGDYYLHSIARGAPNLIELAMDAFFDKARQFVDASAKFASFGCLERLYLRNFNRKFIRLESSHREIWSIGSHSLASA